MTLFWNFPVIADSFQRIDFFLESLHIMKEKPSTVLWKGDEKFWKVRLRKDGLATPAVAATDVEGTLYCEQLPFAGCLHRTG